MGSTRIVETKGEINELLQEFRKCYRAGEPVGFDTETRGCNPRKQSPVGNAVPICATFAWYADQATEARQDRQIATAYVPAALLGELKSWFKSDALKVGTNLYGFDRHVLNNIGIQLNGVVGDTLVMSRLLNPDKNFGHGLKKWGERLGYTVTEYADIASVPKRLKNKIYKRTQVRNGVLYLAGEVCQVDFTRRQVIPVEELMQDTERFQKFCEYACQDAEMSLAVYEHLRGKLEQHTT